MLEIIRDYLKLSPDRMLVEIQGMRRMLVDALGTKGISYEELRAALAPDRENSN